MPLVISDEVLEKVGITPGEALIEFACRLFYGEKLHLWPAAQLAGLSRVQFEDEFRDRHIPIHRPTIEDLATELTAMERMGIGRK